MIVYYLWRQGSLAGADREKLEWAAIRFLRAAVLSGADQKTYVRALEGAKQAYEKLKDRTRVEDLKQRIAKAQ